MDDAPPDRDLPSGETLSAVKGPGRKGGIMLDAIRHKVKLEAADAQEGTQEVRALTLGRAQTGMQAFGRNVRDVPGTDVH